MFGIGSTELLVIFVVALIVLGPKSLPGIAKTIGKAMGEFRKVSTEFQRTMNAEVAQEEHEQRKKEAEQELFGDNDNDAKTTAKNKQSPTKEVKEVKEVKVEKTELTKDKQNLTASQEVEQEVKIYDELDAEAHEKNIKSEEPKLDANSPLAKALAKAEQEANTIVEPKPESQTVQKG